MSFYLIYFGLPVALYIGLCLLPAGRIGWVLTAFAGLGASALFVFSQSADDSWGKMLASLFGLAVVMAILPRLIRHHMGFYLYLVVVAGLLAAAFGLCYAAFF